MILTLKNFNLFKAEKNTDKLLSKIDLTISSGILNVIQAESGLGKTSLLNVLSGMEKKFNGEILLNDKEYLLDKDIYNNIISYDTSDGCFINELTVEEQLNLSSSSLEDINYYVEKLELDTIYKRRLSLCSKGEQARVALASVLLKDADVYLFDEPTANLDDENKKIAISLLKEKAKDKIVILVTHDYILNIDDINLYTIENKKLVLKNSVDGISCSSYNENKNNNVIKQKSIFSKLAFRKIVQHPVFTIFNILFCCCFLFLTFYSTQLQTITKNEIFKSAISQMPSEYNYVEALPNNENDKRVIKCSNIKRTDSKLGELNIACLEELDSSLQPLFSKYFDSYTIIEENNVRFFPIVITSQQKEVLDKEREDRDLKVGSILPVEFDINGTAAPNSYVEDKFVVAGIVDFKTDLNSHYSDLYTAFPAIIRKSDYLSCIENTGIRSLTVSDSFEKVIEDYKEYCKNTNLENNLTYFGLPNFVEIRRFSEYKNKVDYTYYSSSSDVSNNEPFIMIPNSCRNLNKLMEIMYSNNEEYKSYQAFFSSYKKDGYFYLPLINDFDQLNVHYDNVLVKGYYNKLVEEEYGFSNVLLVSDDIYDSLINSIKNGNKDYTKWPCSFVNKDYLIENYEFYMDNANKVLCDSWSGALNTYNNLSKMKTFILVVSIITGVFSFVMLVSYMVMMKDQFTRINAVLKLNGFTKWNRQLIYLMSIMIPVSLSYVITLIESYFLSNHLVNSYFMSYKASGTFYLGNSLLSFMVQLLFFIVLAGLIYLISLIPSKKSAVLEIKEDE